MLVVAKVACSYLRSLCTVGMALDLIGVVGKSFSQRRQLLNIYPGYQYLGAILPLAVWGFIFHVIWPSIPNSAIVQREPGVLSSSDAVIVLVMGLS